MFAAAVARVTNSMFPIYRKHSPAPGAFEVCLVGTGFFIDAYGMFVTVAHIFDGAPPDSIFQYRGRSPDHVENPALPITELARDNGADIVIARVDAKLTHGLDMSDTPVEIGRSVCVAGYPFSRLGSTLIGTLDVRQVQRYFQPAMVVGYGGCEAGGRVHQGFLMTDFSLFGMSGGPVFTTDALVVGIQASVLDPRVSVGAGDRKITVENAVAIGAEHVHTVLQQLKAPQAAPAKSA